MATIAFTGVKSCTATADSVDVVFTTRYSGDLVVNMTRACLGELVAALSGGAGPAVPTMTNAQRDPGRTTPPAGAAASPTPAAKGEPGAKANGELKARVPKKWAVGAETQVHNVVLLLLDPQTDRQSTFALSPQAATQMADALVDKAKVVAGSMAARTKAAPPGKP